MVRSCKTDGCARMPAPGKDYCAVCRQQGKHRDGPANILARDGPGKYKDDEQNNSKGDYAFMRYGRVFR